MVVAGCRKVEPNESLVVNAEQVTMQGVQGSEFYKILRHAFWKPKGRAT